MVAILPCNEVCPDGKVQYVGPYAPNPTITTYRRFQVPRNIIQPCPQVVGFCHPLWFFRAFGFDLNFDTEADVPPVNDIDRFQFPENSSTLAKVQVSWYEYGESKKKNHGKGSFTGGPIGPAPGRFARAPQLNTAGSVFNSIIMDIGTGVGINIPPAGRIIADILVPDIEHFLEAGHVVAPGTPTEETMVTRVTPSGFLTDDPANTETATYTQSVWVSADDQPTIRFLIPPLARKFTAYVSDADQAAPDLRFLYKIDAPLDIVVAEIEVAPRITLVPENAEAVEVVAGTFSGIVTIVFSLEF